MCTLQVLKLWRCFQSFQSLFGSLFLLVSIAVWIYFNLLQNTEALALNYLVFQTFYLLSFLASVSHPQGPFDLKGWWWVGAFLYVIPGLNVTYEVRNAIEHFLKNINLYKLCKQITCQFLTFYFFYSVIHADVSILRLKKSWPNFLNKIK